MQEAARIGGVTLQIDPSRTDTYAWSAHPTADLLNIVAGITPASPGYRTIRIAPSSAASHV